MREKAGDDVRRPPACVEHIVEVNDSIGSLACADAAPNPPSSSKAKAHHRVPKRTHPIPIGLIHSSTSSPVSVVLALAQAMAAGTGPRPASTGVLGCPVACVAGDRVDWKGTWRLTAGPMTRSCLALHRRGSRKPPSVRASSFTNEPFLSCGTSTSRVKKYASLPSNAPRRLESKGLSPVAQSWGS